MKFNIPWKAIAIGLISILLSMLAWDRAQIEKRLDGTATSKDVARLEDKVDKMYNYLLENLSR